MNKRSALRKLLPSGTLRSLPASIIYTDSLIFMCYFCDHSVNISTLISRVLILYKNINTKQLIGIFTKFTLRIINEGYCYQKNADIRLKILTVGSDTIHYILFDIYYPIFIIYYSTYIMQYSLLITFLRLLFR